VLGLSPEASTTREGQLEMTLEKARSLLRAALEKTFGPQATEASPGDGSLEPDMSPDEATPDSTRADEQRPDSRLSPSLNVLLASARADEAMALQQFLYWKDE
jgi:hypothetical protein